MSEIAAYLHISGVRGEAASKFYRLMQAMDSVALNYWAEKNSKD